MALSIAIISIIAESLTHDSAAEIGVGFAMAIGAWVVDEINSRCRCNLIISV